MKTTKEKRQEFKNSNYIFCSHEPKIKMPLQDLISDIEEFEAKLEMAKEALRKYADADEWNQKNFRCVRSYYGLAKEALEKIEE